MPRQRSPDRDTARDIYIRSEGKIQLCEIAERLNLSEGTIRGWKAKDNWDKALKGTFQSDIKNMERSNRDTERSNRSKKKSYAKDCERESSEKNPNKPLKKTDANTPSPLARYGNKNAKGNKGGRGGPKGNKYGVGNKGGLGGPIRNKKALKTGEFETVFFTADILDDEERALLDADYDKYVMQYILIDTLNIREKRILQRIKKTESMPDSMIVDSVKSNEGVLSAELDDRDKDVEDWLDGGEGQSQDGSLYVMRPSIRRVMELEEALTRVQARKQQAIAQLHRMEMEDDRLSIDLSKLEIYKQRISGRIDLDSLIDDEELEPSFDE